MAGQSSNTPANPFDNAFELFGHAPLVSTACIHANELEQLVDALTTRSEQFGRIVLLRSPRAGFGKTHLLIRLNERVASTHDFIALEPCKGRYLNDELVLDAVLRRFSRMLPDTGGLTYLDVLARRLFARGLEPLVLSGEVPSQDKDSALDAILNRPFETFDFHNQEASTAQWALANFSLLGPRLSTELAEQIETRYLPVAWWIELLFRYSSASLDQSNRNGSLFKTVFGGQHHEADMHEKLVTLLNLFGLVTTPVLVLDEVEGLSSSPECGLEIVTFLNAVHQSCKKLILIISVNGDVWQTAFLPRLPCGLKDRLTDIEVDLKPITQAQAMELLRDRAGDQADLIADELDFETGVVYPRGIVRSASHVWSGLAVEKTGPADGEAGWPVSEDSDESNQPDEGGVSIEPVAEEPEDSADIVTSELQGDPADIAISGAGFLSVEQEDSVVEDEAPELANKEDNGEPRPVFPPAPKVVAPASTPFKPLFAMDEEESAELKKDLPEKSPAVEGEDDSEVQDQEAGASPFSIASEPKGDEGDDAHAADPAAMKSPFLKDSDVESDEPGAEEDEDEDEDAAEDAAEESGFDEEPAEAEVSEVVGIKSPFLSEPDSASGDADEQAQDDEGEEQQADEEAAASSDDIKVPNPVEVDGEVQPHTVTQEDHDRVEDLLKQFRDRYGRE